MESFDWIRIFGRGMFAIAAAAVPDIALMSLCLGLWVAPGVFGVDLIPGIFLTLAMEFFSVHAAGVFILVLPPDRKNFGWRSAFLLGLYLAGIGAVLLRVCLSLRVVWPVLGFFGLTANRLSAWWKAPDTASRRVGVISWVVTPLFYVFAALFTTYAPLPGLGITPAVIAAAHLSPKDGLWGAAPQRGLAFGVLYFGLQAAFRRWNWGERLARWSS